MEEKHHIVPEFLLRRFAENDRLLMVPRDGGEATPSSVERACKEGDFYALDPDPDLENDEEFRSVEELLSLVEGVAKQAIERMAGGTFPPTVEDRFHLSLFMAIQLVRGWAGREDFEEILDLGIKSQLRPKMPHHLEEWKQQLGRDPSESEVARYLNLEGVRMHVNRNWALGMMLKAAAEGIAPWLFERAWRLYLFSDRVLLTSDEPVGLYARPGRDLYADPIGPATADAIYFPIDPTRALALLLTKAEDSAVKGNLRRAQAINVAVARGAKRWIFHHPDTDPLMGLTIPERPTVKDERVSMEDHGDRIVETRRLYRA